MNREKILIVEDDERIRNFISYVLKNENFSYIEATNLESAKDKITLDGIILCLLDLGLPDGDGIMLIKNIRKWSNIPIIVISARSEDQDKALALDLGADDYITKPFSKVELMARIRVQLRHLSRPLSVDSPILEVLDIKMDVVKHEVYIDNEKKHLTPLEFSLMELFLRNPGKVLTTSYIIKEIYGTNYSLDTQALRTLVASLRRKIEEIPQSPKRIITEIGVGYRLNDEI